MNYIFILLLLLFIGQLCIYMYRSFKNIFNTTNAGKFRVINLILILLDMFSIYIAVGAVISLLS